MNKLNLIKALSNKSNVSWYKMEVAKEADTADVYIYDEISWCGVSADQFVKELNAMDVATIRLHLNTPGGSVFDGIAIYNALKQHKATVETYIEGVAASSGSIVALAGDKVYMADNAFYMIHHPWVLSIGNSTELRKTADMLDKISGVMVNTYMKVTGKSERQINQWLDDETWFTAVEAKEAGFIDEITEQNEPEAKHSLDAYDNVPRELLAEFKKNSEKPSSEQTRKVRESMRMRLELTST